MSTTDKFTHKADCYARYRPTYPKEFLDYLFEHVGFAPDSSVADVGAGTGILTRLLAEGVGTVYAVEPNAEMRAVCIEHCRDLPGFLAVDGSAEETTLPDDSVDFVTAAQAFHWFDPEKSKREFRRILRSDGRVVLVWNSRVPDNDLTRENAEHFRRFCPEFKGFSGRGGYDPGQFDDFFLGGACESRIFQNNRHLTLEAFIGGSLSASYAPLEGNPNYREFVDGLTELFHKYSRDGILVMESVTHCYVGQV